ncbi:MAG: hypothetical protein AAB858_01100 [Patescibacteria group bacterium]
MTNKSYQKGFIGRLILILVALFFIASFFNFDIKNFIGSPITQKNLSYVVNIGQSVWRGYLEKPSQYLWNSIFTNFVKVSFTVGLENLKAITGGDINKLNIVPILPRGFSPATNSEDSYIPQSQW